MKTNRVALSCIIFSVVVALAPASTGQAANKYKVLHYFKNSPASSPREALVSDAAGNLYGTTVLSSRDHCQGGCGVVFRLKRKANGKFHYSIVHHFAGSPDGEQPWGNLILDSSGNLYGTTSVGGAYGYGTVFECSPHGSNWLEKILYSFGPPSDLSDPFAGLVFDAKGNLFGTAGFGGTSGWGGVFELQPSSEGWKEKILYSFSDGTDGGYPNGDVVLDAAGNIYSTAYQGGTDGVGLVFQLSPSPDGTWAETVLYNFTGGNDGSNPTSGLIFDAAGDLYGTAPDGGNGNGTAFELVPSMGTWRFSVLHGFVKSDGSGPVGGLTFDSSGNLYGTTRYGGSNDLGVLFKLAPSASNWTATVLQSFNGKNGAKPNGGVILDHDGVIYGITSEGGIGYGVVFTDKP